MKKIIYLITLTFLFTNCKKAEDRKCFKSTGGLTSKEIIVPSFNQLFFGPHIKYVLVQDTIEKVVLTGGKNVLNLVETNVSDNKLSVINNNKCNFLRSYKKEIIAEIHLINVFSFHFEGTKELTCKNTLNLGDVSFTIRDGAGEVNLNLTANSLAFYVTHGWGNFNLTGNVNFFRFDIRSNGFGNAYNLNVADSIHVISSTAENVKINTAGNLLRTEITGGGDVWYIETPTFLELNEYGDGRLIDKN